MFEDIERAMVGLHEMDSSSDDSEMQHDGIGVRIRPVSPGNVPRRNVKRQRGSIEPVASLRAGNEDSGGFKTRNGSHTQRRSPVSDPRASEATEANTNDDCMHSRLDALTERIMMRSKALRSKIAASSITQKLSEASKGKASHQYPMNQLDGTSKVVWQDIRSIQDSKDAVHGIRPLNVGSEQPESARGAENPHMRTNPMFDSDDSYSELSGDAGPVCATEAKPFMDRKDQTLAAVIARQQDAEARKQCKPLLNGTERTRTDSEAPKPQLKPLPKRTERIDIKGPKDTRRLTQSATKGKVGAGKSEIGRRRTKAETASALAVNAKHAGVVKSSAPQKRATKGSMPSKRAQEMRDSRFSHSQSKGGPRDSARSKRDGRLGTERPGHDRRGQQEEDSEGPKVLTSKERRAEFWAKQQELEAGGKGGKFRKNRPGQRTRQKFAARMHGADANHLKPPDATASQNSGKKPHEDSGSIQKRPEVEHPSWLAKQREREMLAAAPKGKKVVFGEDGPTHTTVEPTKGGTVSACKPHHNATQPTAPWKGVGVKGGGGFSKPHRDGSHSRSKGSAAKAIGNSGISDARGRDVSLELNLSGRGGVGALGGSKGASAGLQRKLSGVGHSGGDKGGLHPSWVAKVQAKKDEKAKMKAALSGKLAVAKKTTFDD